MSRIHFFLIALFFLSCENNSKGPSSSNNNGQRAIESNASDSKLFNLLSKEETNVNFINEVKQNLEMNIVSYEYLVNGAGVAIGDINNDGLPDLYFGSTLQSNKLFLNKGDLKFEDITAVAGVQAEEGFKTGVSMVDLNGDGFLDIYVCRTGKGPVNERSNLLFINNQDNTFTEKSAEFNLLDESNTNQASYFDYDLDGDLDIYLVNHPLDFENTNRISASQYGDKYIVDRAPKTDQESDRLYRNNGNNTFTNVTEQARLTNRGFGLSVCIIDINEDSYPDIFVANDYIVPDHLYINNGDGTFTDQADSYFRHTSQHSMGSDVADFNNDGHIDLYVLDMLAEENFRQKTLMSPMQYDRVASMRKFGYGNQMMRNVLQLNNGNGSFSEISEIAGVSATDWSWGALFMDFDNDSKKDLFVGNGYRMDVTNLDYMKFIRDSINKAGGGKAKLKSIDDLLDLIPTQPVHNYMFRNNGDLTFEDKSTSWGFEHETFSNGTAYSDLDKDGDMDLVINNIDQQAMIYENLSNSNPNNNYLQVQLKGNAPNTMAIGSQVRVRTGQTRQYQELYNVRGFLSSVEPLLHFGLENNSVIEEVEVIFPNNTSIMLTNVEPNQRLILDGKDAKPYQKPLIRPGYLFTETPDLISYKHDENSYVDFKREYLLPHQLSRQGPTISVGDVNGDGLDDVFVGGASEQSGAIFIQTAAGKFTLSSNAIFATDKNSEDNDSQFFDADSDGDLDLYVVSGGNEFRVGSKFLQDRLYLNDGNGVFSKAENSLPVIDQSGSTISVADFDGDKDLDVFVGSGVNPGKYPTSPISYLLQNDGGVFHDVSSTIGKQLKNAGMIRDAEWMDYNADGKIDLLITGEWMNIEFYKNTGAEFQLDNSVISENLSGWWNDLTLADFDNDGDQDIVASNLGLNCRLHASKNEPLNIYAADFDGNSSIDPIITFYENGKEFPLPQKDLLVAQIPSIKKKFVKYSPYAASTIKEVFDDSELKNALKLTANNFETSILENNGDGTFKIRPLPTRAQLSKVQSSIAVDLNKDGLLDIMMVENDFGIEVETGRLDAGNGLVLINKGDLNFEPMLVNRSGFNNPKDSREIVQLKLANGESVFVVGNNNESVTSFRLSNP